MGCGASAAFGEDEYRLLIAQGALQELVPPPPPLDPDRPLNVSRCGIDAGVRVGWLKEFLAKMEGLDPEHSCSPRRYSTLEVVQNFIKPRTRGRSCSYVALLEACSPTNVGKASAFVSHAWQAPFADLVAALTRVLKDDDFAYVDILAVRHWDHEDHVSGIEAARSFPGRKQLTWRPLIADVMVIGAADIMVLVVCVDPPDPDSRLLTDVERPPERAFLLGAKVVIQELHTRPELNGLRATVTGLKSSSTGRCTVVTDSGEALKIKPLNLVLASPPPPLPSPPPPPPKPTMAELIDSDEGPPVGLKRMCAFYRTWCLAELAKAAEAGTPVVTIIGRASTWSGELLTSGHRHEWEALSNMARWDKASTRKISLGFEPSPLTMAGLTHRIDMETAMSVRSEDHKRILDDIARTTGLEAANALVRRAVRGAEFCAQERAVLQAATGNLLPLASLRGKELLRAVCAAAASGLITPLKALLERGEVHAKCGKHSVREGVTALHVAAELGHVAAVELLLKAGANVNDEGEPPHKNWTPLMFAARWGNAGAVTTLLQAQADAGAQLTRAMDFKTALQIAESPGPPVPEGTAGHQEVQRLLRAHMASRLKVVTPLI